MSLFLLCSHQWLSLGVSGRMAMHKSSATNGSAQIRLGEWAAARIINGFYTHGSIRANCRGAQQISTTFLRVIYLEPTEDELR